MNDLKKLYYCIRVEFERNKEFYTITKTQKKHIEEYLMWKNKIELKLHLM